MNIARLQTSDVLALGRESALCAFRSRGTELQLFLHSASARRETLSSSRKGSSLLRLPSHLVFGSVNCSGLCAVELVLTSAIGTSWTVPSCLSVVRGPGGPGATMTDMVSGSRRTALRYERSDDMNVRADSSSLQNLDI
mgnify:CR=1 FL=1